MKGGRGEWGGVFWCLVNVPKHHIHFQMSMQDDDDELLAWLTDMDNQPNPLVPYSPDNQLVPYQPNTGFERLVLTRLDHIKDNTDELVDTNIGFARVEVWLKWAAATASKYPHTACSYY